MCYTGECPYERADGSCMTGGVGCPQEEEETEDEDDFSDEID